MVSPKTTPLLPTSIRSAIDTSASVVAKQARRRLFMNLTGDREQGSTLTITHKDQVDGLGPVLRKVGLTRLLFSNMTSISLLAPVQKRGNSTGEEPVNSAENIMKTDTSLPFPVVLSAVVLPILRPPWRIIDRRAS